MRYRNHRRQLGIAMVEFTIVLPVPVIDPANFALPAWISATVWPFAARLMPDRSGAAGAAPAPVVG